MEQKNDIHHGKFISKIIEDSKKTIVEISELSGYSRTSIYRWFVEEKVDMEKIHKIAEASGVDVSGQMEELDYYRSIHHEKEIKKQHLNEVIPKNKYYELMDKMYDTMDKLQESQERYYTTKERLDKIEHERNELKKELEKRDKRGT